MKAITINRLTDSTTGSLKTVSEKIKAETTSFEVNEVNWSDFPYRPEVQCRIAHTDEELYLQFEVNEKYIRAMETRTNGDVYKDSCVEFFLSTDGSRYYNFEFSCIGTLHLAYGSGRHDRQFLPAELTSSIEVISSLGSKPFGPKSGDFQWELTARIPLKSLAFDTLKSFNGLKAKGNFYKCGDETTVPHFVTWNPVLTREPDYHRPEFFGELTFSS